MHQNPTTPTLPGRAPALARFTPSTATLIVIVALIMYLPAALAALGSPLAAVIGAFRGMAVA